MSDVLTNRLPVCGKTTHGGFICTLEPEHAGVCVPFVDGDIKIDPDGKVWITPTPSEGAKMRMLTDVLDEKNREIEELRASLDARDAEIKAIQDARQRIHDRFGHRDADNNCQCPYCLKDAEALEELAADYEWTAHCAKEKLAAADAAIAEKDATINKLTAERDGLRRTLDNDPDGAAKRLQNLARMYTTCDRCEQETTEQNESNIVCDACVAKSEQAREALQARIEKIQKWTNKWDCLLSGPDHECKAADELRVLLADAPDGGQG